MYTIWTEKYRPEEFKEVVGQKHVVKTISSFVRTKELPHLLFAGPAGSGKSTIALIIAKKLFGKRWRQNFLEMNASDTRGIDVIRGQVKNFARTKSIADVPYKIIFLDEADSLTKEAQNALRRTMENYSEICRFCLSCNYSSRIIEPIQSRCAVFRFKFIPENEMKKRLNYIAKKEKIKVDSEALSAICELSNGDMRKAINLLQAASTYTRNIKKKTIYDVAAKAEPKEIKKMMEFALNGKFIKSRKILIDLLTKQGISGEDIVKQISREIYNLKISEKRKIELIEKIGEFEFRLDQGGSEIIQLEALLAQFALHK
ncbi:MAG: replication factor C small subunit [Candidatus Aenigmatarchaeota archaeon]